MSKTHRFKNSVRKAITQQKRNKFKNDNSHLMHRMDTDAAHPNDLNEQTLHSAAPHDRHQDSESTAANSDAEQQQQHVPIITDYTTSILAANINNNRESTNMLNRADSNQSLDEPACPVTNSTRNEINNSRSTSDDKETSANSGSTSSYLNQPFKCLANSIDPKFLLTIIKDRLDSHKSVDINATTMNVNTGSGAQAGVVVGGGVGADPVSNSGGNSSANNTRAKCIPSARVIACQHHCVAILGARLFAILCNEKGFQRKLFNENQEVCFNLINDLLYPNNDPVSELLF